MTSTSRTFIVRPDGTGEIYNLQIVEEQELPEFFKPFKQEKDDSWEDAARRWLFFNASHLSRERIEEIVETHNEEHERILEPLDFHGYTQVVHPVREQPESKEYAIYNIDRACFLGELGGFTERQTFTSKRDVAEFLLDQVHNHGHLKDSDLKHLEVVSIRSESELTEIVREAAQRYGDVVEGEKPNEQLREEILDSLSEEVEQETEVAE